MSFGIVRPGIGSHSPLRQSRTSPNGWASSSGLSCSSGAATTSVRVPRCFAAMRENDSAMRLKMSQSVAVSHGGVIAGLKECTNGCRSVVEMSCFSYHVAAGSTTSECSAVPAMRKSSVTTRSSLPSGALSRQRTSFGRCSGGVSDAVTVFVGIPSRCLRKYSWPLLDEPSRFERQIVSTRGKLSGASGSSQAKRSRPAFSSSTT